jgi:hypothetical protein
VSDWLRRARQTALAQPLAPRVPIFLVERMLRIGSEASNRASPSG